MKDVGKALLAILAVAVTIGVLWNSNRAVISKEVIWEDVVAEAWQGGYQLIRTEELRERWSKGPESILLIDTRQEWEYRTGHIKGALNFPIEPTWLSRWRKKGELEKLIGSDKNRFIVFY